MGKVYAHRDLKICTKDCLCLFVCPTGATNNETGQIDSNKCIGCGACAAACPARAISMIPVKMPPQQSKNPKMIEALDKIVKNKIFELWQIQYLLNQSSLVEEKKFLKALYRSNKLVLEDFMREKGYMLPESKNAQKFLQDVLQSNDENKEIIERLLNLIEVNE